MLTRRDFAALSLGWVTAGHAALARQAPANYDEGQVPRYTLPPLLRTADGRRITTLQQWRERRAELQAAFAGHVYGHLPRAVVTPRLVVHESASALDGRATRTQASLVWDGSRQIPSLDVLVYAPASPRGPVPVFAGLNFFGNHAIHADPAIRLSTRWMRSGDAQHIQNHAATERSRGTMASRWPVERIVEQGCAVMTAYCGDLAPDDPAEVDGGIAPLFADEMARHPAEERWGALGMWAWGLSQMREAAASIEGLDATRAIVIGHSRLGKAALWAGATDEQFAMVVSNDSGCGGAALSRRAYGETVGRITTAFPHWFCGRFASYANREADLPVDQHQLLALVAPRPLYVASAVEDRWADPRGEFLSTAEADAVYRLLSVRGLGTDTMPPVDRPAGRTVRYHIRTGGHDLTTYDWQQYLSAVGSLLT